MRVAGFGFRSAATLHALLAAIEAAGGIAGVTHLATGADKAGAPVALALSRHLGLPLVPVPRAVLTTQGTATCSLRSVEATGAGSLAEAAALAVAGPGARLLRPRATSPDGMATAALAERPRS
ncbi:cobalamin biosynthesis protein [Zavarzinia aquatilis]|uniref:Precorrin methylase n=1 Tax=Zavarzinia aquatilis TaxID=2211142 RepID=A0A317DU43_9PROT|nr:cobalamin biosynthesis protein [Zavarzinia aquatilis]PWR18161.1 precorrin methylase [Zavarzinia aquatilis]